MKQSSRRLLIIGLAALLGAAAFWYWASQSETGQARQVQQPIQGSASREVSPAQQGQAAGQRLIADQGQTLRQRSALKREGAQAAPIAFSVLEMKTRKPIEGALVSVYQEQGGIPLDEAFADGNGQGSFEASQGRYRIEAVQDGYQKGKAVFTHQPQKGASHQVVFLSAAFYMRGTVRDEQGQALAGAEVVLKARGQEAKDRPEISLQTDDQGKFEISLPPAAYRVEFRKEPYLPKVKPFILVGPRNAPLLEIELKKP